METGPRSNHRYHIPGDVYFVTCNRDGFPIKIGFTTNLKRRLYGIQTTVPYPLVILALIPGTRRVEGRLHRQFKKHRLSGEWFARAQPILDAIAEANGTGDVMGDADPWHTTEELRHHMAHVHKALDPLVPFSGKATP